MTSNNYTGGEFCHTCGAHVIGMHQCQGAFLSLCAECGMSYYGSKQIHDLLCTARLHSASTADVTTYCPTCGCWYNAYSLHVCSKQLDNVPVYEPTVPLTFKRTPYKCPVCNGTALVSRPPGVAGDMESWVSSSFGPYKCGACEKGVIWG